VGATDYVIRNYRPEDFDSFVRLRNESARLSPDTGWLSASVVRRFLSRPGSAPDRELFVAEAESGLVGYLHLTPEPKIGRAVLDCFVSPEHRRAGLARRLCRPAVERAGALGAHFVHVNVREANAVARLVLERGGFLAVRTSLELVADLAQLPAPGQTTLRIRPLRTGEGDKLTDIQNRSFTGAWGFSPNTAEEIAHQISAGAEGIRIAVDGKRPAAYCWARIQEDGQGGRWGRIGMLGVDPDYQGRGLGRELLLEGLSYLREMGLDTARLTVDSRNTAARALYDSVGFRQRDTSLWYEKALD